MILPGLYGVLSPMAVGMLGGSITSGMMLAIMMANAGGAWDNSKKYIGRFFFFPW
jgi:Na+/H+-translocating membrane pyrophosphatase